MGCLSAGAFLVSSLAKGLEIVRRNGDLGAEGHTHRKGRLTFDLGALIGIQTARLTGRVIK